MPRGKMPRQPSRSGRQEGAVRKESIRLYGGVKRQKRARTQSSPSEAKATTKRKTTDVKSKNKQAANGKRQSPNHHNPTTPERVRQIIAGLDQMYPAMTCALTHRNA
jgi:hypothetical protein